MTQKADANKKADNQESQANGVNNPDSETSEAIAAYLAARKQDG